MRLFQRKFWEKQNWISCVEISELRGLLLFGELKFVTLTLATWPFQRTAFREWTISPSPLNGANLRIKFARLKECFKY